MVSAAADSDLGPH